METRALHVFPTDGMAMDFPYARGVVVVRSRRTEKKRGATTEETRYYLSSDDPESRTPKQWHHLIRGHWAGVENRNHWRRDALFGEDGSLSRNPTLLANLSLIRNAILRTLPRCFPGESVPEIREQVQSNSNLAFRILSA